MFDFRKNHFAQALVLFALGWLVVKLSTVILLFFIAFLFILVLHPLVRRLKEWHFPTVFAVLVPILGVLAILAGIGFYVVPTLADQINQFANQAPTYIDKLQHSSLLGGRKFNLDANSITKFIQSHSSAFSNALITITTTAVTVVVGVVTIIVVTVYGVGTYDRLRQTALTYVPHRHRARAHDILTRIEKKVVTWVWAQLLLSVVVGFMVWIGSMLLGLPFAGILGVISGVLELIPTLGPIAATVPGFLLGLTISLKVALGAIVLHIVVSQIESHVLAPWLLGRTVNLHPIVIIFSLLVGTELYGILGTLLAVPAALVISAVVDSFRDERKSKQEPGALTPEKP